MWFYCIEVGYDLRYTGYSMTIYIPKVVRDCSGFKQLINDRKKATNVPSMVNINQQPNIVVVYWYIL